MMWEKFKQDLRERYLDFESFNGAFIFIPWGAGLIYCGKFNKEFGYEYMMVTGGLALMIWGLRKVLVNRIKQKIKVDEMVKEQKKLQEEDKREKALEEKLE